MSYYKKIGKRYVPVDLGELDNRWPAGLYLIYQNKHSSTIENLTVQKVHECKDLGLYADMVVSLKEQVIKETIDSMHESYNLEEIVQKVFISIINQLNK